jgi:pimeloyl-ACP methyl ester carboxylesterase
MTEEVIRFGPFHALVGIVAKPDKPNVDVDLPAVVMLNAGLMHRVGPNRIYVKIARALVRLGFMVLRFDFSGVGDSRPRTDHLPYLQSAPAEAKEAMDWLTAHHGVRRFVLMGHCSGAGFSYLLASQDERVVGAAVINFEGGSEEWTEFDRRRKVSRQVIDQYRREALFSRAHWTKLLSGRADYRSIARQVFKGVLWYRLTEYGFNIRQATHRRLSVNADGPEAQSRANLQRMVERGVAITFIHSEGSTGQAQVQAALGDEIERLCAVGKLDVAVIPQSDHLFTLVARQQLVTETLKDWMQAHWCTQTDHA